MYYLTLPYVVDVEDMIRCLRAQPKADSKVRSPRLKDSVMLTIAKRSNSAAIVEDKLAGNQGVLPEADDWDQCTKRALHALVLCVCSIVH